MIINMREILQQARKSGIAVGAFNILNHLTARAVVQAAESLELPVILQTSVSTVKKYGVPELGELLHALKLHARVPVILHLDHCRDPELAKLCIDGRWDAVMLDGSHLPLEENIALTAGVADYAHARGKQVEGELGVIAGVEDDIVAETGSLIDGEHALRYIRQTGVDLFAPAIGTAHGEYKGEPKINFGLVEELSGATECPIVVHGGTGLSTETFQTLIRGGASKINVSTAIKLGYREGLVSHGGLRDPLEIDERITETVRQVALEHMRVFSFRNR